MISLRALVPVLALAVTTSACIDPATEHRVRANAYLRGGDAQKALDGVKNNTTRFRGVLKM